VFAPAGSRYVPGGFSVATAAAKPFVRDIAMTAGILVRGRATDGRTGKPLQGRVEYFVFTTNPHLRNADGVGEAMLPYHYWSDDDGRFEIPVLPGKGILAFTASDHKQFPRGAGAERIDGPSAEVRGAKFVFRTQPYYCVAANHHFLAQLDAPPGAKELTVDLTPRSGASITGRIFAPDGQPLSDYYIFGESYGGWRSHEGEAFEIKAYFPKEGRRLMFYHPGRNLVGLYDVAGEPPAKLDITLRPGASIVGRVADFRWKGWTAITRPSTVIAAFCRRTWAGCLS
jgi:hypothetical protein